MKLSRSIMNPLKKTIQLFIKIIKLMIIIFIPLLFSFWIFNFYNINYISYKNNIIKTTQNKEKLKIQNSICTYSNSENNKLIAKNNNLDYYEGDIVKQEVSKNFSNSAIPDSYKISESDLEEAYALGKGDTPIILMLQFKDKENFAKMNEFFGYGEMFVNYNKRANTIDQQIYIGNNFENLDLYIKSFDKQKCY